MEMQNNTTSVYHNQADYMAGHDQWYVIETMFCVIRSYFFIHTTIPRPHPRSRPCYSCGDGRLDDSTYDLDPSWRRLVFGTPNGIISLHWIWDSQYTSGYLYFCIWHLTRQQILPSSIWTAQHHDGTYPAACLYESIDEVSDPRPMTLGLTIYIWISAQQYFCIRHLTHQQILPSSIQTARHHDSTYPDTCLYKSIDELSDPRPMTLAIESFFITSISHHHLLDLLQLSNIPMKMDHALSLHWSLSSLMPINIDSLIRSNGIQDIDNLVLSWPIKIA
jgi:hypothetical protein